MLLLGLAIAGSAEDLSGWARSSVELTPDARGDRVLRSEQELVLSTGVQDFEVSAWGSIATSPWAGSDSLRLYRLSVTQEAPGYRIQAGRLVHLDDRGFLPLDGIAFDQDPGGPVVVSAWMGRPWHPESNKAPDLWLLGSQLTFQSSPGRRVSTGVLGWEGHSLSGTFDNRLYGSLAGSLAERDLSVARVELGLPSRGLNIELRTWLPLASWTRVGGAIRWTGLEPVSSFGALRSPMDWLADSGYGSIELTAASHRGPWSLYASGGPTWFNERPSFAAQGGEGRLAVDHRLGPQASVGVFGASAGIGGSWLAGGGVQTRLRGERLGLEAETGAFQFQGIDSDAVPVWELRLEGAALLAQGESSGGQDRALSLSAELSAGSDRLQQPWVLAAFALQGQLGAWEQGR